MKINKFILKIVFFSFIFNFCSPLFCEDTTPKPYTDEEFSQVAKDIRRFEIITLGSMPFVTLDTMLVYSGIKYFETNKFISPFANAADGGYTKEEQKKLLLTSLGISVGIAVTDLIVQIVKRNKVSKTSRESANGLQIIPIEEDPDAVKIQLEEKTNLQTENQLQDSQENNSTQNTQNEVVGTEFIEDEIEFLE